MNRISITDETILDVSSGTKQVLDTIRDYMHSSPLVVRHTKFWSERGKKIDTLKALFLCYYSSLNVVKIPANLNPIMLPQVSQLYQTIAKGCDLASASKENCRSLLDSEALGFYTKAGFDHFSTNLHNPFDFIDNFSSPLSAKFTTNISQLASLMKETLPNRGISWVFGNLARMIAVYVLLDIHRSKSKKNPTKEIRLQRKQS